MQGNKTCKKSILSFISAKSMCWLSVGLFSGFVLALVETFISSFMLIILKGAGLTNQNIALPLGLSFQNIEIKSGLVLLILLAIFRSVFNTLSGLSAVISNEYFQTRLKLLQIRKSLYSSEGFASLSDAMSYFNEIIGKSSLFFHSTAHMVPLGIQAAVFLLVLCLMSFKYTFIGFVVLGISATVIIGMQKIIQRTVVKMPEMNVKTNESVNRIYKNWFLIKILKIENNEYEKIGSLITGYSTKSIYSSLLSLVASNLPNIAGIILICAFILQHSNSPEISGVEFVSFLYLFLRLVQILSQIANFLGLANINYPYFKISWKKYCELEDNETLELSEEINSIKIVTPNSQFNFHAENMGKNKNVECENLVNGPTIEIENLNFRYKESNQNTIKDLSIEVKSGEHFTIMGPSGVGKSTLLAIIMGVLKPKSGKILINNLSPEKFLENHAINIAYVGAEAFLIEGTLFENLKYGNPIEVTKNDILKAFKDVDLINWFESIDNNFNYYLTDTGKSLSTGQRQRLSIARAILRKPKLLILDEVSSNLDNETEEIIAKTINELKGKTTVVLVTHRKGIAKYTDRILNLGKNQ